MLSDIIKQSSIPASKVPGFPVSYTQVLSGAGQASALHSVTLPAGIFAEDGDRLEFCYWGQFAGPANSQVTLSFFTGSPYYVFDSGLIDPATNAAWPLRGSVIRRGALSQVGIAVFTTSGIPLTQHTTGSVDFSSGISIDLGALSDNAGDVTLEGSWRQMFFVNR